MDICDHSLVLEAVVDGFPDPAFHTVEPQTLGAKPNDLLDSLYQTGKALPQTFDLLFGLVLQVVCDLLHYLDCGCQIDCLHDRLQQSHTLFVACIDAPTDR